MTREEMKYVLNNCSKIIDNTADMNGAAWEIIDCIDKLSKLEETPMVTISLDEYKELIMIKGRYEELKAYVTPQQIYPAWDTKITYRSDSEFKEGEKE